MEYMKEKKPCIDGIPLQYVCHLQDMKGTGMVYPAHYHEYIEILFGREETFEIYLVDNQAALREFALSGRNL